MKCGGVGSLGKVADDFRADRRGTPPDTRGLYRRNEVVYIMRDFEERLLNNIHFTKVRSFCMESENIEQIEQAETIAILINKIEEETQKSIVSIELTKEKYDLYILHLITFATIHS
jgi:hypothetical protein